MEVFLGTASGGVGFMLFDFSCFGQEGGPDGCRVMNLRALWPSLLGFI